MAGEGEGREVAPAPDSHATRAHAAAQETIPVARATPMGRLAKRRTEVPATRAAPVKRAPWEPYLPLYFWIGGVAAGGWLAATAEDWAGAGERDIVRAGRYLASGGVLAGTVLLIADLGRPERFLHMLRLVQPRSAMSLGSWGLAAFGAAAGGAAMLQLAEDLAGPASPLARASRSAVGRGLHLTALPLALFVGAYTGTLLASTSTPAWARRRLTLPPLFLASGVASGLTATAAFAEMRTSPSNPARRRLARASTMALAAELGLTLADDLAAATLPSQRSAPPGSGVRRALALIAGTLAPLVLAGSNSRRRTVPLLTAALALGGSLALRYRITNEGYRSAERAADTWAFARGRDQAESAAQRRAEARGRGQGLRNRRIALS